MFRIHEGTKSCVSLETHANDDFGRYDTSLNKMAHEKLGMSILH
jgi:hypothetical protein